jgi:HEAT repeat protein
MGAKAKAAVPALAKALKDEEAAVRAQAVSALADIGDLSEEVLDALAHCLTDEDASVRRAMILSFRDLPIDRSAKRKLIVHVLKDSDPAVAGLAVHSLAEIAEEKGEEALESLAEALKDDEACYWGCLIASEMGPAAKPVLPGLIELLGHQEPDVRLEALMAIAATQDASRATIAALLKALEDKQAGVQYAAIFALGNMGDKAAPAASAIKSRLKFDDPFVQAISAWALVKIEGESAMEQALPVLIASLKSDDERARLAAARSLLELKPDPAVVGPELVKALKDKNPQVVGNVIDALATLGAPMVEKAIPALKDKELRSQAAVLLGRLGADSKAAVPALVESLKDEDRDEVRRDVILALAAIGPDAKAAASALVEDLGHENPRVQVSVTFALGKIGPAAKAALPQIKKNLESEDETLAAVSAWALPRIAPADASVAKLVVPKMTAALKHEDAFVRREAAETLGMLGPQAKAAAEALEELTKDADEGVAAAAKEALAKVTKG